MAQQRPGRARGGVVRGDPVGSLPRAETCGIIPWTSGEIALFVVRHVLGVRFEGSTLAIRPALYPGSPSVRADLRFRAARIRVAIDGAGPIASARVNGEDAKPDADGVLRLPPGFAGGEVSIRAAGTAR